MLGFALAAQVLICARVARLAVIAEWNALAHQKMTLQVVPRDGSVLSATLYDQRMFRDVYGGRRRKRVIAELNTLLAERSWAPEKAADVRFDLDHVAGTCPHLLS